MNRKICLISGTVILLQLLIFQGCEKNRAGQEVRLIIPRNETEDTCFIWATRLESQFDAALNMTPLTRINSCYLLTEGTRVVILEEKKKRDRIKILEGPYYGEIFWIHTAFLPN